MQSLIGPVNHPISTRCLVGTARFRHTQHMLYMLRPILAPTLVSAPPSHYSSELNSQHAGPARWMQFA